VIWPLLRTRRWLGFTVVVVVTIVAFGLLSRWQWARADEHRQERLALAASLTADPVPLAQAMRTPLAADEFRPVEVTGVYDAGSTVLVRRRPLDAQNGFWVMSPLTEADGTSVWVNRGWIAVGGDALATPTVPAPPRGTVTVDGYLRPDEEAAAGDNAGLPAGQIAAASAVLLPADVSAVPGFVQLSTSSPKQSGLVPWPLPDIDESRNVSYAMQWLLFAAVAMSGWYYFLRREAKEDAQRSSETTAAAAPPEPLPTKGP
jgi:cytochrome oxidase assembly protein ShyY1